MKQTSPFLRTKVCVLPIIILYLELFNIIMAQPIKNPVIIDGKARFTIINQRCIRLEYSQSGKFIDNPSLFAANRNVDFKEFSIKNIDGKTIIRTSRFALTYKPDGKPFSQENLEVYIQKGKRRVRWVPGLKNKINLGGTLRTLDQVKGKVTLDDGLLSKDGWFLLDDSNCPILTKDWVKNRPENSGTDWYLFAYGLEFKEALKSLTKISGEIPIPRKYVLGSWYSRYWPYSSNDYHQIVNEYEQYDFPLDIIVLDMDWHKDGWTGLSWNRKLLPDAEDLLKWFHKKNLFVTLNDHPAQGVQPYEDSYKKFMKDMGVDVSNIPEDKLPTIPYDASNKKYMDVLFKDTHLPLEKEGVDFWWLDWQQFEYTLGNKNLKNLEWLNRYYFNYSEKDGKRGISFSRWGGWGDQKYPIHFSGDASTNWEMLKFEIPFTSTSGNVGCFFWSHDIGGHMGGINPETNARWVQFGAVSAALRLHSTRDKTMDKRPWLFEKKYFESMKTAFHLRSELFPYIYSSVRQSSNESIPLIRPMYIEYPKDYESYESPQQYFFGDAFLAAPINQAGIGENKLAYQKVWFPKDTWYNWFTGEKISGKDIISTEWADIYEFPFYVKGGVPIPMQPYTQRMTTEPLKQLVVRTYPGRDGEKGEFTLYEDDGITNEYKEGQYALTKIQYTRKGNNYEIRIAPVKGNYKGQLLERSYLIEFPGLQKAEGVSVNERSAPYEYDEENFMNKVQVPETNINKGIKVIVTAKEADYSVIKNNADKHRKGGLNLGIDFQQQPEEIIKKYLGTEIKPEDKDGFISLLSGVAVYVDDIDRVSIIKDPDSKAGLKFSLTISDKTFNENKEVLKEDFNLKNGENKVVTFDSLKADYQPVTRKLELKFSIGGKEIIISKEIEKKTPYICDWNIIGPFDYDTSRSISKFKYEPEKIIDLSASYLGKQNKEIKWQKVKCEGSPIIDFNSYFPDENSIAYAYTNIKSDADQDIVFNVSSDDGVEVWLNKEKIHSHNVFRGIENAVDKVEAKLRKGDNFLLIKVSQGNGGWGFKINFESENPVEIISQ